MALPPVLETARGSWTGTNGFRLMPTDPMEEAPATAALELAAGGHLATLRYAWTHPQDGPQEGLLVLGRADEGAAAIALWADSWHQHPQAVVGTGTVDERGVVEVGYTYAGTWRWQIVLDATDADALVLRMDNVVPAEAATDEIGPGPYAAMSMTLRRGS